MVHPHPPVPFSRRPTRKAHIRTCQPIGLFVHPPLFGSTPVVPHLAGGCARRVVDTAKARETPALLEALPASTFRGHRRAYYGAAAAGAAAYGTRAIAGLVDITPIRPAIEAPVRGRTSR